jgi:glycosyltransferase involved in cell wall biosynthesis
LAPDVVHTNSLKSNVYGGIAGRSIHVPVVWHVRDRIDPDYLPAPVVRIVRLLGRVLPARVIANSHATAATVHRRDAVVIHDVYRGGEPRGRSGSVRTVAIVGRISPWKGQHVLLEAFAKAFPDGDERCLVAGTPMFGELDYDAQLRALVVDLGIAERVDFVGHVEDVDGLLRNVDVLVHASTTPEPFGQVIVEGLAAGVPVIAADAGGAREIVMNDVDGLLTPPGDVSALATALRRLASDAELRARLASAGLERAEDFRPERMAPTYLTVYRTLASRRR